MECFAVDDGDTCSPGGNGSPLLKLLSAPVTPARRTLSTVERNFLREVERVAINPVVRHQEPPRQTLHDRAMRVRRCRMRDLQRKQILVAQQQRPQHDVALDRFAKGCSLNPERRTSRCMVILVGSGRVLAGRRYCLTSLQWSSQ